MYATKRILSYLDSNKRAMVLVSKWYEKLLILLLCLRDNDVNAVSPWPFISFCRSRVRPLLGTMEMKLLLALSPQQFEDLYGDMVT